MTDDPKMQHTHTCVYIADETLGMVRAEYPSVTHNGVEMGVALCGQRGFEKLVYNCRIQQSWKRFR